MHDKEDAMKKIFAIMMMVLLMATPAFAVSLSGTSGGVDDADLTTIAGLTVAQGKFIIGSSSPAWSASAYTLPTAVCTSGYLLKSDGTNMVCSNSLSVVIDDSAAQFVGVTTDHTGKAKIDLTTSTPTKTTTLKLANADDATITFPSVTSTLVAETVATGGVILGDTSPDAAGELGYASTQLIFHDGTAARNVAKAGTLTNTKWCSSDGTVINCTENPGAGTGDMLADGSVPMTGDLTIQQATPDIILNDSDDAAGTASIKANSSGGTNDIVLTIGVEDSSGAGTAYIEVDGVSETVDLLKPVAIAAAGVKLTGDNGSLTILGIGDGQDEDVKIDLNTTANQITISSPASSADTVSFSALNLVTTGTINGAVKVEKDDDTLASSQCYGTFHWFSGGAETITLPAAVVGMNLCVYASDATVKNIDPNGTDTIVLTTAALAAGCQINSSGAAGDFICLVSFTANQWTAVGRSGVWVTHGAD